MIPLELPAPNSVNKTEGESKLSKPKVEVGSIDTTVP